MPTYRRLLRPFVFSCLILMQLLSSTDASAATKQLYLSNFAGGVGELTRDLVNLTAVNQVINQNASVTFIQNPAFQAPFTINSGTVSIPLQMQRQGGGGGGIARTAQVELYKNAILLGTSGTINVPGGGAATLTFTINLASNVDFVLGDTISLVVKNVSPGNVNIRVRSSAATPSFVAFDTDTVITIDSITLHPNPYNDPLNFFSYTAGSSFYIRVIASDPFGSADVSSVDISVVDPNMITVFNTNVVTQAGQPTTSTAAFEALYTLPVAPAPDGVWLVDVIANEGSEGTVTATGSLNFGVGTPLLTVQKTSNTVSDPINIASDPKAIPNALVEYTVTITNSGFGYVDDASINITDILPTAQATFYFGSPINPVRFDEPAGETGLDFTFTAIDDPLDDVEFSNDGCTTFVASPSYDMLTGLDTTVPKINCIKMNPKGTLFGSDGVNDPVFTLSFTVQID